MWKDSSECYRPWFLVLKTVRLCTEASWQLEPSAQISVWKWATRMTMLEELIKNWKKPTTSLGILNGNKLQVSAWQIRRFEAVAQSWSRNVFLSAFMWYSAFRFQFAALWKATTLITLTPSLIWSSTFMASATAWVWITTRGSLNHWELCSHDLIYGKVSVWPLSTEQGDSS